MSTYSVGYFVGSLSTSSIDRLLAKALVRPAPPGLDLKEIPLKDLPLTIVITTTPTRRWRRRSRRRSLPLTRYCS